MDRQGQNVAVSEVEDLGPAEFPPACPPPERARSGGWMRWLELLWSERQTLCRTAIWALIGSTVIAFLIPKHYESTVSIMPPDSMEGSGMMMAALSSKASPELAGWAASALGMKSSGALFVSLLRSRTVEEDIVDRFSLQSVYWTRYKQDARRVLDRRTDIAEDRKSGVITVTVADSQPQRARDLAQAFVEELNKLVSQVSTSSARRQRIFIEQRLAAVKVDLEDAEQQFSAFASKNTALDIKEQTRAMVGSAAVLQGQLIAAQSELEGLLQMYSVNNFRVRSAQAQVDELKRQLQKINGTDASLQSDHAQSDELYPSIRKLPLLGVQWADLYRRAKIQETVYELLNQQYELVRIQEAKEVGTVNIVDPANLPEKKSWPPRLLITSIITVLSLVAVAATIVIKEQLEFMEEDDPRRHLAKALTAKVRPVQSRILAAISFAHFRPDRTGPRTE